MKSLLQHDWELTYRTESQAEDRRVSYYLSDATVFVYCRYQALNRKPVSEVRFTARRSLRCQWVEMREMQAEWVGRLRT